MVPVHRASAPQPGYSLRSGVCPAALTGPGCCGRARHPHCREGVGPVGSVIKKRRKRMAKKKHRKLLKKTRIQRRNKK